MFCCSLGNFVFFFLFIWFSSLVIFFKKIVRFFVFKIYYVFVLIMLLGYIVFGNVVGWKVYEWDLELKGFVFIFYFFVSFW